MKLLPLTLLLLTLTLITRVSKASEDQRGYFKDLINTKSITNTYNFLEYLPKKYKKNFTLVFDSRSPFKDSISYEYPRVVLFTDDAKTIITFTGHPKKPGNNLIEFSNYIDKEKKFVFYQFDLNHKNKTANSKNCTECHGKDPRPISDSYPLWPGFYGAVLDSFPEDVASSEYEEKKYLEFKKNIMNTTKNVYQQLYKNDQTPHYPYLDPEMLKLDKKLRLQIRGIEQKPNQKLGILLTSLNKNRLLRKMKKNPSYDRYKKDILYEFLGCSSSRVKKADYQKLKLQIETENKLRLKRLKVSKKDLKKIILQMQESKFIMELSKLNWALKKLDLSIDEWSLALEENSYSFFDGLLSGVYDSKSYYIIEDLIYVMLEDLSESEPQFKKYLKTRRVLYSERYAHIQKVNINQAVKSCKDLKTDWFRSILRALNMNIKN